MNRTTPDIHRKSVLGQWAWNLYTYDGALPAVVYSVPAILVWLFGPGPLIALTAVFLPITALIIRSALGLMIIERNSCHWFVRALQKMALFFGLFCLLTFDAIMIVMMEAPPAVLTWHDVVSMFALFAPYLVLMAFATYPGRRGLGEGRSEPFDRTAFEA